jgi:hypothetical protein
MVYALLCPICFESDNAFGEGETFFVNNDKTMMYSQQAIEEEELNANLLAPLVQKGA